MNIWANKKKYGNKKFKSRYVKAGKERTFELVALEGTRVITFESYQAAQSLGWTKIK